MLREQRGLTVLNLGLTKLTDADLTALVVLPVLKELFLDSTGVSDAGLSRLVPVRTLETISLNKTAVTRAGGILPQGLGSQSPRAAGAEASAQ